MINELIMHNIISTSSSNDQTPDWVRPANWPVPSYSDNERYITAILAIPPNADYCVLEMQFPEGEVGSMAFGEFAEQNNIHFGFEVNWGDGNIETFIGTNNFTHDYSNHQLDESSILDEYGNSICLLTVRFFTRYGDSENGYSVEYEFTQADAGFPAFTLNGLVTSNYSNLLPKIKELIIYCPVIKDLNNLGNDLLNSGIESIYIKGPNEISTLDTSSNYGFSNLYNLRKFQMDDASNLLSMFEAFKDCYKLRTVIFGTPTSSVENFTRAFRGTDIKYIPSNIDVSGATNTQSMFEGCKNLREIRSTDMTTGFASGCDASDMFAYCTRLTQIDQSINFFGVINASRAFQSCESLTEIDISVIGIQQLESTFQECINLEYINLRDTLSVQNMTSMCYGCTSLDTLYFETSENVKFFNDLLSGCRSIKTVSQINLTSVEDGQTVNPFGSNCSIRNVSFSPSGFNSDVYFDFYTSNCLSRQTYIDLFTMLGTTKVFANNSAINLGYNPIVYQGLLTAEDIQIATDKGWNVQYD